jgi:hypothetical protein
VLVLIQWAWSYFTFGRGARLITQEPRLEPMALPPAKEAARAS